MKVEQRLWSPDSGWQPSLETTALGEAAQLVLLFGSVEQVQKSECLARARALYPKAHLVGCTTAGLIHDARVLDGVVTLTAVSFEHTRVDMVRARIDGIGDSLAAGERLGRQLAAEGLRHVFVLSE